MAVVGERVDAGVAGVDGVTVGAVPGDGEGGIDVEVGSAVSEGDMADDESITPSFGLRDGDRP